MEPIWLALIALVVTVVTVGTPVLTIFITNRNAAAIKKEDWERQDKVAAQAAEAARLLLASNERVARTAEFTNGKLDVIHTLVNSNFTAAMQAEYDATIALLTTMQEIVELKRKAGDEPSPETIAAIEATKAKIAKLRIALDERLRQAKLAEQRQEEQRKRIDAQDS